MPKIARVGIAFIVKLGTPFYAFHDRNIAPEGQNLRETNKNPNATCAQYWKIFIPDKGYEYQHLH